jgi:hypothetical protein
MFLIPIFSDLFWKFLKTGDDVIIFELWICPSKEVGVKTWNPQTPIKGLVTEGVGLTRTRSPTIKYLVGFALMKHHLFWLGSIPSVNLPHILLNYV